MRGEDKTTNAKLLAESNLLDSFNTSQEILSKNTPNVRRAERIGLNPDGGNKMVDSLADSTTNPKSKEGGSNDKEDYNKKSKSDDLDPSKKLKLLPGTKDESQLITTPQKQDALSNSTPTNVASGQASTGSLAKSKSGGGKESTGIVNSMVNFIKSGFGTNAFVLSLATIALILTGTGVVTGPAGIGLVVGAFVLAGLQISGIGPQIFAIIVTICKVFVPIVKGTLSLGKSIIMMPIKIAKSVASKITNKAPQGQGIKPSLSPSKNSHDDKPKQSSQEKLKPQFTSTQSGIDKAQRTTTKKVISPTPKCTTLSNKQAIQAIIKNGAKPIKSNVDAMIQSAKASPLPKIMDRKKPC